jgi:hypothetical protein
MRDTNSSLLAPAHPAKSLAARGGTKRTFGSIAVFFALIFMCLGAYIIEEQFANPLAAQPTGLFAAAVTLATGAVLLCYLLRPRKNKWHHGVRRRPVLVFPDRLAWTARRAAVNCSEERKDLTYQRGYVDAVRIRPRH